MVDYQKEWNKEEKFISKDKDIDQIYRLHTHKKITPQEKILLKLIDRNSVVLDIGCSYGRIMRLFPKARGIDVSGEMLKRNPYKKRIKIMDATKGLKFKDGSFDNIICMSVLLHLKKDEEIINLLSESSRVLKKGGSMFVNVRNNINLVWAVKRLYWRITGQLKPIHARNLTVRKLGGILKKIGFSYEVFLVDKQESIIKICMGKEEINI